jgi:L-ascorbate metabolism protein UlaG (beta-lactamase superfamily)
LSAARRSPHPYRARAPAAAAAALTLALGVGCVPATILGRNVAALARGPRAAPVALRDPRRPDARLVVTWLGHASWLVQLDDRFVLTDPVLGETVGAGFSRRLVAVGVPVERLPPIDVVVVSHLHLDHLSQGSLDALQGRAARAFLPEGGLVYAPPRTYPIEEVPVGRTVVTDGLRVTAVPVRHPGYRFGVDAAWMRAGATAWVIEYRGLTVYFAGDTAAAPEAFRWTARRFPSIDVALLPIAPVEPPSFARATHLDGDEAVDAFLTLGARQLVPMHYDTFAHGVDPEGYALDRFQAAVRARGRDPARGHVVPVGGQHVVRAAEAATPATAAHGAEAAIGLP